MRQLSNYSATMLESLEEQYPNRVRKENESELEHERYAGKVDLLAEIRTRLGEDSQ